jgi:hypothetical protein
MLRVDLFFQVKFYASLVCCRFNRRVVDALYYTSTTYKPHTLIDVATLTGFDPSSLSTIHFSYHFSHRAMSIALGEAFTGVFSVRLVPTS